MMSAKMTDKPIKEICSKCGKKFIQREIRTCTSLNNFIKICPKCKKKDKKNKPNTL